MAVAIPGTNASAAPALTSQKTQPNQSLYIQNLPEKLQKEDLRRALYMLFSTYGPVLDVTALKAAKMRGQAHILFRDVHSATQAMRSCQAFEFFGREMKISYSKNRSNTLAKLTGTFNQPTKTTTGQPDSFAPPQSSSFAAPPGTGTPGVLPGPPSALPPPPGLPPKVNGGAAGGKDSETGPDDVASPQGVKRQREESVDGESDEESESEGESESEPKPMSMPAPAPASKDKDEEEEEGSDSDSDEMDMSDSD